MLGNLSPYALLCACKPKPTPTLVTAYDLYSQAQSSANAAAAPIPDAQQHTEQKPVVSSPAPLPFSVPNQRTHYIAGIQSRHSAAIRRTPMQAPTMT